MDVACGSSEYWLMAAICPGSAIRINTASTQGLSETMRCGLAAAATDCGNTQRIAKARYLKNRIRTPLNNNMGPLRDWLRSESHTSELQSLMRISYAVFCLKTNKHITEDYTKSNH